VTSQALQSFLAEVEEGGDQSTLTYALGPFQALRGDERITAEDLLIARARQGDLRAVETLGLGGVTRALAVLERLSSASNNLGSAAARAVLALMGPDPAATTRVAEGVRTGSRVHSALAAYELRTAEGADATRGLLEALGHPFVPTRANAILGLKTKMGLEPLIDPKQSPLWVLMQDVTTELPSVWKPAARRLREVLEALLGGASPQDLGLIYERASRPEDIDEIWTPNDVGFDFDALLGLRGHDLVWAKSYLFSRLDLRDDRAPEAMVVLGMVEALPALRKVAPAADARGVGEVYSSAIEALEVQASAVGDA
jgi:hypothetical protein